MAALLLATLACSGGDTLEARLLEDAEWEPRSTLVAEQVVLHSPLEEQETALWLPFLASAVGKVAVLLDVSLDPPPEVRLVPFEPPVGQEGAMVAAMLASARGREGLGGYATGGRAVVYVPMVEGQTATALLGLSDTLRHEAFHVLAERTDLPPRPRWVEEGLASVVEGLEVDAAGAPLWDVVTPAEVLGVRDQVEAGTVARLLAWGHLDVGEALDVEAQGALYPLAHAFCWYLLRQQQDGTFVERSRVLLARDADDLLAEEEAWRSWLADLDPGDELFAALGPDRDVATRKLAASRLATNWASVPELREERFVRRALEGLRTWETFASSSQYLMYAAASRVPLEDVEALVADEDPARRLMGQALRKRRDLEVDREAVARDEAALDVRWTAATTLVRAMLRR